MKRIKRPFILIITMLMICANAMAQEDVTLVVSADGATKDEATKTALRSAIEQAYGTFVSANTTILNDELVKDEIASITTGNIKSYKEISSIVDPNGRIFVTLQATVSPQKLISYAQSKGASAEFAGATFGMNLKIEEMNKKAELVVLNNLTEQLKTLLPTIYKRVLTVKDPIVDDNGNIKMSMDISFKRGDNFINGLNYIYKTLRSISVVVPVRDSGINPFTGKYYTSMRWDLESETGLYDINGRFRKDDLSPEEIVAMKQVTANGDGLFSTDYKTGNKSIFKLRNDSKDVYKCYSQLAMNVLAYISGFKIVDNLGVESYFDSILGHWGFTAIKWEDRSTAFGHELGDMFDNIKRKNCKEFKFNNFCNDTINGHGLFNKVKISLKKPSYRTETWNAYAREANMNITGTIIEQILSIEFTIPRADLDKYTRFDIVEYAK